MLPLRIVFMGTPEFAVPCLKALLDARFDVVAVYSQPDRPAGRGRGMAPGPVKMLAAESEIAVVQPDTLRSATAATRLAQFAPDVIVVAAYGLLLPETVLDIPRHGCVNVHPSLLPRHRGPSPIPWAILEGDHVTGVSMMLMDAGMDTGPVLEQVEVPVSDDDTALELRDKLAALAASMLPCTLDRWAGGEIMPRAQDNTQATYSRLITKKDGEIDWKLTAVELWRRVRAFHPWPGCYTSWNGCLLRITEAEPLPELNAVPGRAISLDGKTAGGSIAGVGTGQGVLGLLKLQLEGKREVTAVEFLRGQRDFVGSILHSPAGPR